MSRRLGAEFLGTAWLVFGGCGSAVLAAAFPGLGIGFVGVSLAFGLTVLTMAFVVGGWALAQLWLFWVAPILGAALAGAAHRWLAADDGR